MSKRNFFISLIAIFAIAGGIALADTYKWDAVEKTVTIFNPETEKEESQTVAIPEAQRNIIRNYAADENLGTLEDMQRQVINRQDDLIRIVNDYNAFADKVNSASAAMNLNYTAKKYKLLAL